MEDIQHDPTIAEADLPDLIEKMKTTGVKIRFRDIELLVDPAALKDARDYVAGLDFRKRVPVLISVGKALDKAYPKMIAGTFKKKKKIADNFHSDVLLFEAFRLSHLN